MLDRLIEFLSGREVPALEESADELQLSVAALLIEAAHMDSSFDDAERATIERLLAKKFDLDHEAVQSLIAQAQKKVAYSDGVLDPYEDALVRQIAGLIHVPDRERGLARRRALEKLKAAGAASGKSK